MVICLLKLYNRILENNLNKQGHEIVNIFSLSGNFSNLFDLIRPFPFFTSRVNPLKKGEVKMGEKQKELSRRTFLELVVFGAAGQLFPDFKSLRLFRPLLNRLHPKEAAP